MHALEHLLHDPLVLGVGSADEEVVGDLELGHERPEPRRVLIGERLGLHPLGERGVSDRLPVLVGAGEKEHILIALSHVARDDVGGDRLVRVPEVRDAVDVGDRGGDVEGHGALKASRAGPR